MLQDDLDVVLTTELADILLKRWEEGRQAGAEFDFGPKLPQALVCEALHQPGLHVAEEVV